MRAPSESTKNVPFMKRVIKVRCMYKPHFDSEFLPRGGDNNVILDGRKNYSIEELKTIFKRELVTNGILSDAEVEPGDCIFNIGFLDCTILTEFQDTDENPCTLWEFVSLWRRPKSSMYLALLVTKIAAPPSEDAAFNLEDFTESNGHSTPSKSLVSSLEKNEDFEQYDLTSNEDLNICDDKSGTSRTTLEHVNRIFSPNPSDYHEPISPIKYPDFDGSKTEDSPPSPEINSTEFKNAVSEALAIVQKTTHTLDRDAAKLDSSQERNVPSKNLGGDNTFTSLRTIIHSSESPKSDTKKSKSIAFCPDELTPKEDAKELPKLPIATNVQFKLPKLMPTKSAPESGHKMSIAEFFKVDESEIEFGDKKLGGGSQGVVMKGRFRTKEVAIKSMQKGVVDHLSKREISLLFSTPHPNIVQAMAWSVTKTQFHIVMEFFDGASLYEVIMKKEVRDEYHFNSEDAKINAVKGIASALSACHLRPQPIVHRDIKPSNILINKALQVKMCDFGFGKCQDLDASLMSECSGNSYGTFTYMPPEVLLKRENGSVHSDMWSFACTVVEIFGQEYLWREEGMKTMIVMQKLMTRQVPQLVQVPRFLHEILLQCFDYDPTARPSIKSFIAVLETYSA
ncbi:hypothetical protein QAD02_000173 [Eretmocerus hayati]|uniref:Uncharacterized protein n=1 Tax=Eretmocerus hayati TaxID=131215 RepID=A0ACC2NF00_9HYME|nr:hypothetical protein QAD02_000173 [Eretmocerus hayati]